MLSKTPYEISVVDYKHNMWNAVRLHLERIKHLKFLVKNNEIRSDIILIVALTPTQVVGHISLLKRQLCIPKPNGRQLTIGDNQLWETFVETFYVEEEHRRYGLGTKLQIKAIEESRRVGCYQMRSWSSFDKEANYELKLKLGFSFAPAYHTVKSTGEQIPGGYFALKL